MNKVTKFGFDKYEPTEIIGVSREDFREKARAFGESSYEGRTQEQHAYEFIVMEMDYRDEANYRIPVTLLWVRENGQVYVSPVRWYDDEEETREIFYGCLYEAFGVPVPLFV